MSLTNEEEKNNIIKICHDICKSRNLELIFLCESGSRSWGYASKDSDYDIRGVYVKNKMDYIHSFFCENQNNIINISLGPDKYDIELWDAQKVINLYFRNANQMPFWWVTSDIIYFKNKKGESLTQFLIKTNERNISKLIYHYFGIIMQKFNRNKFKVKDYIHVFRSIMCINYAIENKQFPPQNINTLISEDKDDRIKINTTQLLKLKIQENKEDLVETELYDSLINEYIAKIKNILNTIPKTKQFVFDDSWKNIIKILCGDGQSI